MCGAWGQLPLWLRGCCAMTPSTQGAPPCASMVAVVSSMLNDIWYDFCSIASAQCSKVPGAHVQSAHHLDSLSALNTLCRCVINACIVLRALTVTAQFDTCRPCVRGQCVGALTDC